MRASLTLMLLLCLPPASALAAFGLILPHTSILRQGDNPTLELQVRIVDPLRAASEELRKPQRFGVQHLGEETSLLAGLAPSQDQKPPRWLATYTVKRPGDYLFFATAAPLWDAENDQYIVHHVKLCVNAFGLEEGWDEPVGLEAEIVPMTRPYGLWAGNLFSGQVLLNGEPAPYALVEITFLGMAPDSPSPTAALSPPFRIQKLHADASGVFHYAMPRAGWWGFAAAMDADRTLQHGSEEKPVTLMTSLWVQTVELK